MKTADVIKHYGSVREIATELNISTQAVYYWRGLVPANVACKLEVKTGGKLTVNPLDYVDNDK